MTELDYQNDLSRAECIDLAEEALFMLRDDYFAVKAEAESLANELKARRSAFEETLKAALKGWEAENAEEIQIVNDTVAEAERKEKELRAAVVAAWPGGKAPKVIAEGLSVRVTPKPVYDEARAIEWAIEKNLPDLLKLDATKFKKAAGVLKPDFVTYEETVTAVIAE